ncbi:hypothetical protein Ade02nite_70270 [Paractinoplanes deccanensis]|uniref:Pentapeptide repeat-containing protein n=1 Tax=Paractinoplanes deccanensis TaxID=113561 RepID=A0ABQ3YEG9_9ACTN|nr:pentapeptide repeat-containing protein [Actinoplanes deccanensis]GID78386.1 hypothetical protein Ade02nite_70270 [Actinoplanes deccanensis]
MTRAALVDRWRTPAGRSAAAGVLARLRAGAPLDRDAQGRADLRGFVMPDTVPLDNVLAGVRLTDVDLSHAQLPGLVLERCVVTGCRFTGANLRDWRVDTTMVSRSDFTRAVLTGAALGTGDPDRMNGWSEVTFTRADLRGCHPHQAYFDRCDFSSARLDGVEFHQCRITGTVFAGPLRRVVFDGRDLAGSPAAGPMRGVDFTGARLDDVEFRNCFLEDVSFPPGEVLAVPRFGPVAARVLAALEGDGSAAAGDLRWLLRDITGNPWFEPGSTGVFVRAVLRDIGGDDLADLAFRIIAKCAAS